jgi:hypothetical protein
VPCLFLQSGRKKTREPKEENVTLSPAVREGEHVFGVAHIFASFNDTFIVGSSTTRQPYSLHFLFVLYEGVWCSVLKLMLLLVSLLQHVTDLSGRETLVRITGN